MANETSPKLVIDAGHAVLIITDHSLGNGLHVRMLTNGSAGSNELVLRDDSDGFGTDKCFTDLFEFIKECAARRAAAALAPMPDVQGSTGPQGIVGTAVSSAPAGGIVPVMFGSSFISSPSASK